MLCKALLLLVAIWVCLSTSAAPITVEQAKMAVHTWASARPQAHMDAKLGKSAGEASSVTNGAGEVLFHVVKLEGGGFVVTSADDTTGPVIAFSECEDLDRDPRNPLWAMLNKDMSERRRRIPPRALNAAKGRGTASEDEWADLLGRKSALLPSFGRSSVTDVRVPVLLKTKWGQGEVNGETTYNQKTPNNYPCGCVATAGAQLMRYHRYPASLSSITNVAFKCRVDGKSSTRYPSSLGFNESEQFMPDDPKLTFSDLSGTKAFDFLISRITFGDLLYSVGVISRMNWTRDGSGAQLFVLADAMVDYCGYANAKYNVRPSGVSSSVLKNAVYANLDAKCPVLLGIADSSGGSGHAIVADGYGYYNSKVYTHLNLGWEGDSDAWYALPMITDAGDYDFTLIQDVVFNVFPQKTDELITGRVLLESGTPCKSMTVKATCGSLVVMAQTDSKGIYALNVRGGRTWRVEIDATGFVADAQDVYVDESISTSCSLSADGSAYVSTVDVGTVGNVWGVDFTAMEKIDPPDTPRNVTATEDSSTQVKVTWSAAARAEKYLILRWNGTAEGMEDAPVFETTATSYIDKTGVPGVRYYYIVMAENRSGTSSYDDFEYAEGMRLVSVSVSPTAKTVLGAGGNYSVSVTANTDWEASTTTGWITLSDVTSGSGNGTVSYVVPPNTTTSARSGSITIFAGAGTEDERTAVLEVSQNRSPVSVTFDAAGGLPTGEVRKLEVGSAYGALPTPSRLGYSLAGWYDGESQVTASSLVPSRDVTLRAKWRANTSTVSFHSEHLGIGAGSMEDQTFDYGTSAALAGCGFTRVGYAFAGWATEQGGPVRYRDGQDILNLSAEDGAKLDFYAVWEEGKSAGSVKVTAVAAAPRWPWNGKVDVDYTLVCEPVTGKATVKLTARDDDRQRDLQPKTLAGDGASGAVGSGTHRLTWDVAADYPGFDTTALDINVEASVETVPAVEGVTASQGTSEDVELSWSPVDKAVAYEIWRGVSENLDDAQLIATTVDLTYEDLNVTGGVNYMYWIRSLSASSIGAFSGSCSGSGYQFARVFFDANGALGVMSEIHVKIGESAVVPPCLFEREGATFSGWAKSTAGYVLYQTGSTIGNITADMTLYAQWKATVSFSANGGSGSMSDTTVRVGNTLTVPDCLFEKSGMLFVGWATSASGAVAYDVGDKVNNVMGNMTLYAKWKDVYKPTKTYLVVDLSSGANAETYPVSELTSIPSGGWSQQYKTTKLVLRKINNGTFVMGSAPGTPGRGNNEDQHTVTISKSFYMGVFEVTQKQYELVMGNNPSKYVGDARPVEMVSYDMIRGSNLGAEWPSANLVDASSFLGKIRRRAGLLLDLPTDAQWEYACRAGTTTQLNSGKNATDANMNELGRYKGNRDDGKGGYSNYHTTVGSYKANNWGLYDMHGNVYEWCLDWYVASLGTTSVTDPKSDDWYHYNRVLRGGDFGDSAISCRSSGRGLFSPGEKFDGTGFRLSCSLGN